MAAFDAVIDFPHLYDMDDALRDATDHILEARYSENSDSFEHHLKMASRALRDALEMHGRWLAVRIRKEIK